jgi:hypothetical protein
MKVLLETEVFPELVSLVFRSASTGTIKHYPNALMLSAGRDIAFLLNQRFVNLTL